MLPYSFLCSLLPPPTTPFTFEILGIEARGILLCCAVLSLSVVSHSLQPVRTVARQAPLSMGIPQARTLEWVATPFSGGIFPTQGSNPGLPHCRWILYCLSHQGSPRILEWVAYPFSRGSSPPRNQIVVSCIACRFFTS